MDAVVLCLDLTLEAKAPSLPFQRGSLSISSETKLGFPGPRAASPLPSSPRSISTFPVSVTLLEARCNIRPEDTYRRKIKLGSNTTGQPLNRALHAFHRLYQASTFGGFSNIGSTKTLLLFVKTASVKTLKLTRLHAEIVSSWLGLSIPRPRGHS